MLVTLVEDRKGMRILGQARDRFDVHVTRTYFVLRHVDWGAFVNDVARTGFERALHDVAHGTLIAVRFVERLLTRAVRVLRSRRQGELPQEALEPRTSRLTGTMTYLKSTLKRTRRKPKALDKGVGDMV